METATNSNSVEYKDLGLDKLIKALSKDNAIPSIKVGILGDGSKREVDTSSIKPGNDLKSKLLSKVLISTTKYLAPTNAEIGAIHELGLGVPIRSFLRAPLVSHLKKYLEEAGAFDKEALEEVAKSGKLIPFMQKIGLVAESVVQDAFNTGGFGEWKPSNMKNKKVQQTLVESQQLRESITSKVEA